MIGMGKIMNNREFTKLLIRARKLARQHTQLLTKINDEGVRRFGVEYSEIDCDFVIDSVDYGHGREITAEEFDEAMQESIELKKSINSIYKNTVKL